VVGLVERGADEVVHGGVGDDEGFLPFCLTKRTRVRRAPAWATRKRPGSRRGGRRGPSVRGFG
jgi:hypothetical protein